MENEQNKDKVDATTNDGSNDEKTKLSLKEKLERVRKNIRSIKLAKKGK